MPATQIGDTGQIGQLAIAHEIGHYEHYVVRTTDLTADLVRRSEHECALLDWSSEWPVQPASI
jgi:hypothetical protein